MCLSQLPRNLADVLLREEKYGRLPEVLLALVLDSSALSGVLHGGAGVSCRGDDAFEGGQVNAYGVLPQAGLFHLSEAWIYH
jgi:hypothetical protein